ncbi:ribonuclease H-like domain-containing protein [Tanacetum coccineum]|uniref:Ribonuclease H-like domain-containing protein n=1 Tax=Tanacetum coccineum TaxID=301880 RepID=A0ABQ4Y705_9ASTR
MSFDDLYNNSKIVKQEVKGTTSLSSQNVAFVSSSSSTNEVNTAYEVSTTKTQVSPASTHVSTTSTQISTANLCDNTIYAFLASQPNGSQLVHEDLKKIHDDDLEEIDLKWQLALLSMRTRMFFQKNRRKITINGSDIAGYDKNRNQDNSRRTVNVKEISPKAMLAIDGAGFDWSYMADDEVLINMALMAFSDSEVRESPDAPLVEELVSNDKKKIVFPTVAKIEFIRPKQQEKPVRKPVKNAEMYRPKAVNTARPNSVVVNAVRENQGHLQKEDQDYVDSGCSRHMTRNMSYLSDFKELMEDMLPLGEEPKEGKLLMCDNKNSVLFTNTRCFVLSHDFKLADESQVLLKVTLDESMLWHRRLGKATQSLLTLIEAARTMLVESKLPTTFCAEAVNTTCYVQNRVLVVKPHNKTSYEQFRGRTHVLSFMRPFGCHVTILNTLDHLGKFDTKFDEGFFVGYLMNSKAFRVYNIRTRKVEENLHIRFLEDKPIIVGDGPKWLFDIDVLTKSINYVPVVVGTNSNDFIGTKESIGAGHSSKEIASRQDCILMPLWKDGLLFDSSSKNASNDEPQSSSDAGKKDDDGVRKQSGIENQERPKNSTQDVNTDGLSVNTASTNINTGDNATLEATHADFFHDETEVDMSNITTTYPVPFTPNTRIHKDHSLDHGYTQEEGIDYDEVFALVARIEAIRLFLAYALFKYFVVYQMDVKSDFLYGKIEEEVYVCQPPGFEDPEFLDEVYKVEKALYGLHQAPIAWDSYEKRLIQVIKIRTDHNVADLLTKAFDTQKPRKAKRATEISQSSGPIPLVADETIIKKWEDIMERAATTASSLEAEQDSEAQIRFEAAFKQSNDPPLSRVNTLRSGEDSMKLKELLELCTKLPKRSKLVRKRNERYCEIKTERELVRIKIHDGNTFSKEIGVNAGVSKLMLLSINLLLPVLVHAARHTLTTVRHKLMLPVFLDKQIEGMSKHKETYATHSHTKKVFANMKREGKGFSGRDTPLFPTMMVQAQQEEGEGSAIPTDPHPTPSITQPSSSQPQQKEKPRRKQRKGTEIPSSSGEPITDEATNKDHIPTHSNDPLLSGEDRLQLYELMEICTNLQKKGRKIADLDADTEVTLIDKTQRRNDEDLMFDTGVLNGDEVFQEPMVNTATTTSSIPVSVADPVTTAGEVVTTASVEILEELTLAQTLIEIKSAKSKAVTTAATTVTPASSRPKAKGIIFHDQEEQAPASTLIVSPSQPSQIQAEEQEEERIAREKAQKIQEANIAWDDIKATVEADYQLAQRLHDEEQEQYTDEEKAKFF